MSSNLSENFFFIDQALFRIPLENHLNTLDRFHEQYGKNIRVITNFLDKTVSKEDDHPSLIKKLDKVLEKLRNLHDVINTAEESAGKYLEQIEERLKRVVSEDENSSNSEHIPNVMGSEFFLNCILHEFLMKKGLKQTADLLIEQANLQNMIDTDIYSEYHEILDNLKQHNVTPALNWCATNRTRLKQLKSDIESQLLFLYLLELINENKLMEAIEYLNKNVPSYIIADSINLKKIITASLFSTTDFPHYKTLYEKHKWADTIKEFENIYPLANHYPPQTMIEVLLQAGFSALKTYDCTEGTNPECPVCLLGDPSYIKQLPTPHRVYSDLICPITKEKMNSENPPYVSPEGRLFSQNALRKLNSPGGTIECPRTKNRFPFKSFQRLYMI